MARTLSVMCPKCSARVGESCTNAYAHPVKAHPERAARMRNFTIIVEVAEWDALRAVAEAARAYSTAVDQGFASDVRPDIARATMNRALAKLDDVRGGK